jgi:hypothetical protein
MSEAYYPGLAWSIGRIAAGASPFDMTSKTTG